MGGRRGGEEREREEERGEIKLLWPSHRERGASVSVISEEFVCSVRVAE